MTWLGIKPWYLHFTTDTLFHLCRTMPQNVLSNTYTHTHICSVSRGPARARTMAYFGEGKGPIHADNVKCTGNERSLVDCIKQDIGTHNCRHSEDAGVICDHLGKKTPGNSNKGEVPFWVINKQLWMGNWMGICWDRKRWK